jgi:hypothetical protein
MSNAPQGCVLVGWWYSKSECMHAAGLSGPLYGSQHGPSCRYICEAGNMSVSYVLSVSSINAMWDK